MNEVRLQLLNVDKYYGDISKGVHAVKGLDMSVNTGEIVALLGSSGCGKTSILRMIAGFENVTSGSIKLAGREINTLSPVKRNVAMAFEGYSLYPPLNIHDNIAFALKSSSLSKAEIEDKVRDIAAMLEISDILDKYPGAVSGGQQQRVSLGRALVRDADLHLLDEPMGQLEPQLRAILRGRIKHYIKSRGLTAILVTHDQAEANALADRIAVMEDGELQQLDSPDQIKKRPANLFAGTFIGEPPMNVYDTNVSHIGSIVRIDLSPQTSLVFKKSEFSTDVLHAISQHDRLTVGIRPYAVKRTDTGLEATVAVNQWLGDQSHIVANIDDMSIVLVEHDRASVEAGDKIHLTLSPDDLHFFNGVSGEAVAHGREPVS